MISIDGVFGNAVVDDIVLGIDRGTYIYLLNYPNL